MGLLDDAIREHLELKRRRGADASEISRQETDALGPVRRSPEGVPDLSELPPLEDPELAAEPDAPAISEAPAPWEDETTVHTPPPPEPSYEPPPVPPPPAAYELPPVPPAPAAYEPPPVPPAPAEPPAAADAPTADEPSHPSLLSRLRPGRREHAEEPVVPPPEPPPEASEPPPAHEPDIVPADDEPDGEELLEETPEFLEETPEHDRLWFEQRPPRDFNFDD